VAVRAHWIAFPSIIMETKIVPFRVVFATSEDDEDHEANELLAPGPDSRGWATSTYCIYPQELVLQLESRTHVERIQFMSSLNMVATCVEILLGEEPGYQDDPDFKKAKFMSVGQVKFQNPAKRELKGRQLQTIELQGNEKLRVSFIKFSLKNNYDHKGNQFNQVGLMGVSVWGKVKPEPNKAGGMKQRKTEAEMDRVPRRQDLAFLMYTDKDVAELIHQLEERKFEAVNSEQFENARTLKRTIEELAMAGQAIGAIDAQKREFAVVGKYTEAKNKKIECEKFREKVYGDLMISDLLELPMPRSKPPSAEGKELPPATKLRSQKYSSAGSMGLVREAEDPLIPSEPLVAVPPIAPKALPPPIEKKGSILKKRSVTSVSDIDHKNEADKVIKLSQQDQNDLALAIEVFGIKNIAGILDKSPDKKKMSCESIRGILAEYSLNAEGGVKPGKMLKASTQAASRLLRDKMWAIFSQGIALTSSLYDHFIFSQPVPKKETGDSALKLYKELIIRCCDTNERVQEKAEDTLEAMVVNEKIVNAETLHEELLKPLQKKGPNEHPKMALVRTDLAFYLIDETPDIIGAMPATKANKMAEFGLSAVNHASGPVRKAGERLLLRLYEINPKSVRKIMPPENDQNRKNMNYKNLYDDFKSLDSAQNGPQDLDKSIKH